MDENKGIDDSKVTILLDELRQFVAFAEKQTVTEAATGAYYPIALVTESKIWVFDINEDGEYAYRIETTRPGYVPDGVLAAMPLDFYENKMAAVIDEKALYTTEGKISILHEFVHCYQYHNGEFDLKNKMQIAQKAMAEQNWMWELEHPFPYDRVDISTKLKALAHWISDRYAQSQRLEQELRLLKSEIEHEDFEYMIWQIWKEGYARFIENRLKMDMGLTDNYREYTGGINRTIFYQIGDAYFRSIRKSKRADLQSIFDELMYGADYRTL